ncbi:hypothetical protein SCLCIDRAFT_1217552 [Scleroderma citrinum Foug A]|uniref:Uncharacterized protein n=1 Tax=Scleroderma citrinum Foug A TaxID=1036808 RepID=A0A0C3A4I9_9AGAM|nr:hypothetical protein SCLCIDRAFT_1217552 [Scleroderma citrinum Foug A]
MSFPHALALSPASSAAFTRVESTSPPSFSIAFAGRLALSISCTIAITCVLDLPKHDCSTRAPQNLYWRVPWYVYIANANSSPSTDGLERLDFDHIM